MNISFNQAKKLIKEADVLLFKAAKFPGIGWWISSYTRSPYSHAALAHWEDDKLYAVEFREFRGSRKYLVEDYLKEKKRIDVFRCVNAVLIPQLIYDNGYYTSHTAKEFTSEIAKSITDTALELIGRKYSYWTIWQIFKTYIPIIRLRTKVIKNGEADPTRFVCSTLITYAYRKHFLDPVPFLSDEYTSPGDLARSGLFFYIFSIKA